MLARSRMRWIRTPSVYGEMSMTLSKGEDYLITVK